MAARPACLDHNVSMAGVESKRGTPWSDDEVDLAIDIYFHMLSLELDGQPYTKVRFNRQLNEEIGRGKASIEYKFQNISAALAEVGAVPIIGYKPAVNMQTLLRRRVRERFADADQLRRKMMRVVEAPPTSGPGAELLEPSAPPDGSHVPRRNLRIPRKVDFQALEEANRSLGLAGERAVVNRERRHLTMAGRRDLADRVRHVSVDDGDGLGYDILSYSPVGVERFLEVKTTRYSEFQPFLVSRNEVEFSDEEPERFSLVRVFAFDRPNLGHYELSGSLHETAELHPEQFSGLPRVGTG